MHARLAILTVAIMAICACWLLSHAEMYCPFYPGIDTHYAPGFSEANFRKVLPGMTVSEVEALVGKPLFKQKKQTAMEEWGYTDDGKCKWGDFAWLRRAVVVSEGIVISVDRSVRYD